MVSHDVYWISNKVEYLAKEHMQLQKFHRRSYVVIASDLCNAIKKLLDRISYHRRFNTGSIDSFFVFRGADSASCIFTFFLVYYFSTAGVVWFVVLSYAWYICFLSLGTTRDNLSNKAVYFHLISWIPPFVLTCLVISLAQVFICGL